MLFRLLAVGDVVGAPGLDFAAKNLKRIRKELGADFVVVNGENANVVGVTPKQCDVLLAAGADAVTLGNHTWTRWELQPYLDESARVLRPANYAPQCPGRGAAEFRTPFGPLLLINLLGRFTLDPNTDNPFLTADALLEGAEAKMIAVDFHAEATSEKAAMAHYLDGRVSAVWGTHTHVQTSDARILRRGTGFITDLGMTGPADSVIGIKPASIGKFLGRRAAALRLRARPRKPGGRLRARQRTGAAPARGGEVHMIRILHAADLHLDSPFEGLPEEKAALRRNEQRQLLRALAQLRAESGAQLVLLAGDLFDSAASWAGTEDTLRLALAEMEVPVFISPGTHDFYSRSGRWQRLALPENVRLFTGLSGRDAMCRTRRRVWGAAFTDKSQPPAAQLFRAEERGRLELLCLHGGWASSSR
ncbi:MAG: YmdB family metallophosphoesterase [Oscillospiraceae bacterium]